MFDFSHPFFRPLWRRVLIAAFCFGWAGFEILVAGSPVWALVFGGLGALGAYNFFVTKPFESED